MEDPLEEVLDPVQEALILGIVRCTVGLGLLLGGDLRGHSGGRSFYGELIICPGNCACKEDIRLSDSPVADLVLDLADHFLFIRLCGSGCAALFDDFLCLLFIRYHLGSQAVKRYLLGNAHISFSGNGKGNGIASVDILAKAHETGIIDRILLLVVRDLEFAEVVKAVIKQLDRVIELIGRLLHEDHADELHAVSLRAGDQSLSGHFHISGLAADDPLVFDLSVDQLVLIEERKLFRLLFGGFHEISRRIRDRAELVV